MGRYKHLLKVTRKQLVTLADLAERNGKDYAIFVGQNAETRATDITVHFPFSVWEINTEGIQKCIAETETGV